MLLPYPYIFLDTDPDTDSIKYEYGSDIRWIPDTDRISDRYKYEYGYISDIKYNIVCIIGKKYIVFYDKIINYKI
jgi:hypothetical protein